MRKAAPIDALGLCLIAGIAIACVWILTGNEQANESIEVQTRPAADKAGPDDPISFNRDIRPILSDKCFACHGPDAAVAKGAGGFRLDIREGAIAPAEASGKVPIVPGDADASEVMNRITTAKPNLVMPPPSSKTSLTDSEVALLKRWINEGAEYEGHWAYQTPIKPELPKTKHQDWVRTDLDHFIAAELDHAGLEPSEEADRTTLIRRLSLDIIGLPPTPEEIDAFVSDPSPDAYEKVVDRLQANPHYGERMALPWLDAARYADTIGYQLDHYRNAWPYRDWVIQAFNDNMPYDRFLIEQLAGDMLPNATDEQRLASAFCRMHMSNHEGGSIDEEFRVVAVGDRIETIATVFMAQTYNCAKCHDHKYDPTSQQDYFNLFKYFHSIDERGIYTNKPDRAIAYAPRMDWMSQQQKAQLAQAKATLKQAEQTRKAAAPSIERERLDWEQSLRQAHGIKWANAKLQGATTTHRGGEIRIKPDGSVLLASREAPPNENITLTLHTDLTGLRLLKIDALPDPWNSNQIGRKGNALVTGIKVKAVSLKDPKQSQDVTFNWAWANKTQQSNDHDELNLLTPGHETGWGAATHQDDDPRTLLLYTDEPFGYEGGTELHVTVEHQSKKYGRLILGRIRADVAAADGKLLERFPVVERDWYQAGPYTAKNFNEAYDKAFGPESSDKPLGKRDAGGNKPWTPKPDYVEGQTHKLGGKNSTHYLGRTILTPVAREMKLSVGKADGARVFLNNEQVFEEKKTSNKTFTIKLKPGENQLVVKLINGNAGSEFKVQTDVLGDAPIHLTPIALIDPEARTPHSHRVYTEAWGAVKSPTFSKLSTKVRQAQASVRKIEAGATPVSIMQELEKPKPMFLLERGEYNKPIKDRPAKLELPSYIDLPLPDGAPNNRLGFAQWLARPDHPLTARVHVNRVWQMLFGTGIVATVEDFGSQAEWPSHPELLDYLAVMFVESGWDQKGLIKQIVMSATYRQRATTQRAAIEIDPTNRLLSSFPRKRMPGELIRDHALAASGLLNETIGGPSVKPYQPDGLWREVSMGPRSNTNVFKRDNGDKLYRRSIYTFIKRKSPPPQLQTFGAPNRESCVVVRGVTNTPLQALVLWNDEQFLEAARVLAQNTLAQAQADQDRLKLMHRRCTGEIPSADEMAVLQEALAYYRQRYAQSPDDAKDLLKQGEYPLPEQHDPSELAAWMMIGNTILSLDEAVVRD